MRIIKNDLYILVQFIPLVGGGFPGMMGNVSPGSNMNFGQQMMGHHHHHHGMGSRHGSVLLVSNLTEEVSLYICRILKAHFMIS